MSETSTEYLEIDIATRVLGENEDIYVIRPGVNFSLYNDFQREHAVFLDFPDLAIDLNKRPDGKVPLREAVVRSMAVREWHLSGAPADKEPSRDLTAYSGKAAGRRIGRYVGAIERLVYDLPVGTILLVPGPGYISDVYIGEITGPAEWLPAADAYGPERMAIRRVRWLATKQKASFSKDLRDLLGRPDPLMSIDRSLRDEVLRFGYKQYIFEDTFSARLSTTEDDFSTLDDLRIQIFVNYVAGVLAADELGVVSKAGLTLDEALSYLAERRDLVPELAQNINSAGWQRLYSETIAPMVIAVLMTGALAGTAFAQSTEVRIRNSAALKADPCAVQVEKRVEGSMKLIHFDEFKKICEGAKKASEATGLRTSMHVERSERK